MGSRSTAEPTTLNECARVFRGRRCVGGRGGNIHHAAVRVRMPLTAVVVLFGGPLEKVVWPGIKRVKRRVIVAGALDKIIVRVNARRRDPRLLITISTARTERTSRQSAKEDQPDLFTPFHRARDDAGSTEHGGRNDDTNS